MQTLIGYVFFQTVRFEVTTNLEYQFLLIVTAHINIDYPYEKNKN